MPFAGDPQIGRDVGEEIVVHGTPSFFIAPGLDTGIHASSLDGLPRQIRQ